MSKVTKLVNKEMERRIEFTFKGKIFTAYLKPNNKYDIYMDGLLVAMAVKEEFMKLLNDELHGTE